MAETVSRVRQIKLPFASTDEKPYIFASYGHDDKEVVFPLLKKLYEVGYNVWYDEGITIGERYDEVIENHIKQSAVFLLFASALSVSRPYVTDIEIVLAYENRENAPIIPLFIEKDVLIPQKAAELLPKKHVDTIEQVIDLLQKYGIENFGEREAVPIEREVPLYWFDGHDLDPTGGTKNIVFSEETPYACLAFHHDDLSACNPYAKELYFAGYNVRSCENCINEERAEMISSDECIAYVPFVTKKYIDSGNLERDYLISRQAGKTLIALYIPTYDEDGNEEQIFLPSSIAEEFSHLQGLDLRELTSNDFLSKLEIELESRKCCSCIKDGKVERRSFEIKGFLYDFTHDSKYIALTKYTNKGYDGDIIVKKSYCGFPVQKIDSELLKGRRSLKSVTIPDSVVNIGEGAFRKCSSLITIIIGKGLRYIDADAFHNCNNLTSIYISDIQKWCMIEFKNRCSNPISYAHTLYLNDILIQQLIIPYNITQINDYAFCGCSCLTSIEIPYNIQIIGHSAFEGCWKLSSLVIPDSVTAIYSNAFNGCCGIASVIIPNSVTTIGSGAFEGCYNLSSISISKKVTVIDDDVFRSCSKITSVTVPNSVTSIGNGAFCKCTSLNSIELGYDLKNIGKSAFLGCNSLISVKIPDSVLSIGDMAFWGCINLVSVIIPNVKTNIGDNVFRDCKSITVYCAIDSDAWRYCEINNVPHKPIETISKQAEKPIVTNSSPNSSSNQTPSHQGFLGRLFGKK